MVIHDVCATVALRSATVFETVAKSGERLSDVFSKKADLLRVDSWSAGR